MAKTTPVSFEDLDQMHDTSHSSWSGNTLGFPTPQNVDTSTPERRQESIEAAGANRQGASFDPATRTVTHPDKSGMRKPQGGSFAKGSNVFIPSDPKMRVNAGGGEGAAATEYHTTPFVAGAKTGNVQDRIETNRGVEPKADWERDLGDISRMQGGHKMPSRERENRAMDIASTALGKKPLTRGDTGAYPMSSGAMQDQQVLARNIMQRPIAEEERFAIAPGPFMSESMSDEDLVSMSNGSVLAPRTDRASLGTNLQPLDDKGMNELASFESQYGAVGEPLPYGKDANVNVADQLMPGLRKNTGVPGGTSSGMAPATKTLKKTRK